MKLIKRKYQPGDETNINKLYKLIVNIDRSIDQYRWEWIDTWNGQGGMWLAFDADRAEGDQLIMQYSLIPTPFSFWGKSYLAGKTENCMCHPDFRGKGQYFQHEKESFEEAKKKYDLFFTTVGDVTKGSVGAIRRKLGYVAFDDWVHYLFCIKRQYWEKILSQRLKKNKSISVLLTEFAVIPISYLLSLYFQLVFPQKPSADIRILNKDDVPLGEIEALWNRNKNYYMITVDRIPSYLEWRINQNPSFDYKYLLYYKDDRIVGYAIFVMNGDNVCEITDIIVDNGDESLFEIIVDYLVWHIREIGGDAIFCRTLLNNTILKKVFSNARFLNMHAIRRVLEKKDNPPAFHVYVPNHIESQKDPLEPKNWYITDFVTEGRRH